MEATTVAKILVQEFISHFGVPNTCTQTRVEISDELIKKFDRTTGAFSWNVKLFSELKLVTDNLFIYAEATESWEGIFRYGRSMKHVKIKLTEVLFFPWQTGSPAFTTLAESV